MRVGLVLEWVYGCIVSTAEKARDAAQRDLGFVDLPYFDAPGSGGGSEAASSSGGAAAVAFAWACLEEALAAQRQVRLAALGAAKQAECVVEAERRFLDALADRGLSLATLPAHFCGSAEGPGHLGLFQLSVASSELRPRQQADGAALACCSGNAAAACRDAAAEAGAAAALLPDCRLMLVALERQVALSEAQVHRLRCELIVARQKVDGLDMKMAMVRQQLFGVTSRSVEGKETFFGCGWTPEPSSAVSDILMFLTPVLSLLP